MTRVAVDFGARFADICLSSAQGHRFVKQPLTDGTVAALRAGLSRLGCLPADLQEIRIATTRPLNRLLAREKSRIALITTQGFGDVLALGRQDRVDLYAPIARSSAPVFLAPREAIHEIGGRIAPDGSEKTVLDIDALERIIPALRASGAEAVAIALLFSHVNPTHELAVSARLADALPGVSISLSHRVDPSPREYERTVASLLDAWMQTGARRELDQLDTGMRAAGFEGETVFGDGRGVVRAKSEALTDMLSVLASGPAAAARGACAATDAAQAVVLDIGSRSADLMLLRDGAPVLADPGQIAAIPLRRDMVDMSSIALGGSSTVGISNGRLTFDAPDALSLDMLLGAAGRLPEAATAAPAPDVVRAVAAHLAEQVIRFATRRNVDPIRADLVVCGGTGGLLAADIATAVGLRAVRLPPHPAATGALGLAMAPFRREAGRRVSAALTSSDVGAAVRDLETELGDTPDFFRVSIAPRPGMFPMTLTLDQPPRDAQALMSLWHEAYASRHEIAPPGPGHLEQISAVRDRTKGPMPQTATPALTVSGAQVVQTAAGRIWVPEGWTLRSTAKGYCLETGK